MPARNSSQPEYVVVDALDESPNTPEYHPRILQAFKRLSEQGFPHLRILVTSQPLRAIQLKLSRWLAMDVSEADIDQDIRLYVEKQLEDDEYHDLEADSKQAVTQTLSERAEGR